MKEFEFSGNIPASKSIYNRALIVKSYFPEFQINGLTTCDDVKLMSQALEQLENGQPIECGHAGTVLRFLALRVSRIPGAHELTGSERLFSRPINELTPILSQLGVQSVIGPKNFKIISNGWKLLVDGLQINSQRSSQFASAVILNAWDLKMPLHFVIGRKLVSGAYLKLTIHLMRKLGMRIEENGSEFFIPANQKLKLSSLNVEPDMSSAFSVAALATVGGRAVISDFPAISLQPDFAFVHYLKQMGVNIRQENNRLFVFLSKDIQGLSADLENTPDLFPVLSVLCALAKTPSQFTGLGHLQFKESSRLIKAQELLSLMGSEMTISDNRVVINPVDLKKINSHQTVFDTDHDHRLAMSVQVARQAGFKIIANEMRVVTKSYPEFLQLSGVEA